MVTRDQKHEALKSAETTVQMVFGIVLNKQNQPIPGVEANLFDLQGNHLGSTGTTGPDGKFSIPVNLPEGEYLMRLAGGNTQFQDHKIKIVEGHFPAFKFNSTN